MNRTSAVICEFNPFHSGHETLINYAASVSDTLICVMSGNFTQRSECAVFDKYKRAEAAVRMGADLVLELPFPYSSAGAEFFAFGGVSVGCAAGADHFIFGSESGDTEYVRRASEASESECFRALIGSQSDPNEGAAVRYNRIMSELGFVLSANDKLGAQYMSAARRCGYDVTFEAFPRMCDPDCYRSATELRRIIHEKGTKAAFSFIPQALHGVYPESSHVIEDKLCEIEHTFFRLFLSDPDKVFFEGEGGVFERLCRAAAESRGHGEFFEKAATKRYTDSRLRRAALFAVLGVKREDLLAEPPVTLLLGASEKGRHYLSSIRKTTGIKILTKPSDDSEITGEMEMSIRLMRRADELYSLCLKEKVSAGEFLRRKPYIE